MEVRTTIHRGRLWIEAASVAGLMEEAGHPGIASQIHDIIVTKEAPENERRLELELYKARQRAEWEAAHPFVCDMPMRWKPTLECRKRFKTHRGLKQHQERTKHQHALPEEIQSLLATSPSDTKEAE